MFGKGLARCGAACMSAAVLLLFSSPAFLSIGASTASADPAVPLTCSPSTASHTFTANNQTWARGFTKQANGCSSIWMVVNTAGTYPFQWTDCGSGGGCGVPVQKSCSSGQICQLYSNIPNGDSVNNIELLSGAPVTVTVYY